MTIALDAKQSQKKSSSSKPKKQLSERYLTSIHLSREEVTLLKTGEMPLEEALTVLEQKLAEGFSLTVGVSDYTGSYYTTIREKGTDWNTSYALSFFHNTLTRCLRGLAFGLETRWKEWPSNPATRNLKPPEEF